MNIEMMRKLFPEAVKRLEKGNCPGCDKPVNAEDFGDNLSVKEYIISGLCQKCQDDVFGPTQNNEPDELDAEIKQILPAEMSKEEAAGILGIDLSKLVIRDRYDFQQHVQHVELWDFVPTKQKNKNWFVPADVDDFNKARMPHCETNFGTGTRSDGYGGRKMIFKCTDGIERTVQGPWHSNTDSLFADTGIDLRASHLKHITICKQDSYDVLSKNRILRYDLMNKEDNVEWDLRSKCCEIIFGKNHQQYRGYDLLYEGIYKGAFRNDEIVVATEAIKHDTGVFYISQSFGGSISSHMSLVEAVQIINESIDKRQ